jgi:hypothetical protein
LADQDCLSCHKNEIAVSAEELEVDSFYRYEGNSDPGDEMIVYTISSTKKEAKGIVVNAYGLYADSTSSAIVKKLYLHT